MAKASVNKPKKVSKKKVIAKKKAVVKKTVSKSQARRIAAQTPAKKKYTLQLDINDQVFNGSGDTITECLSGIKPLVYKTKAVIGITDGKKQATIMMMPFQMKRLLLGKQSKAVFEKRMLSIMK